MTSSEGPVTSGGGFCFVLISFGFLYTPPMQMQMNDKPKKKKKLNRGRVKSTRESTVSLAVTLGIGIDAAVSCHSGGFHCPQHRGSLRQRKQGDAFVESPLSICVAPKGVKFFFWGGGSGLC